MMALMLLKCQDIVERMSAIVDGEASLADRWRFRAHLAMCKQCTAYFEQFMAVKTAVGTVVAEDLPQDFDEVMAFVLDGRPHDLH